MPFVRAWQRRVADGDEPWLDLPYQAVMSPWPAISAVEDGRAVLTREDVVAERQARAVAGGGPDHFLLARAAWEDGVVTDAERRDLDDVALVLGLPARPRRPAPSAPR